MSPSVSSAPRRLVSDELCALVEPLIPPRKPAVHGRTGRPRTADRDVLEGIAFDRLHRSVLDRLGETGRLDRSRASRGAAEHHHRLLCQHGHDVGDQPVPDPQGGLAGPR
ncbi:Putative transposase of IS4/5 family [Geodermatophilus amargosae]|uniref:Putative transposase of IS4/5 family n=1 Tax=Geodermatophilus amargosae TaxID=1296565 RepID=A0A1I7BDP3_9ACTN|nr:Putative transposase of IS4/5 family [Geodermatophilus amargosae]